MKLGDLVKEELALTSMGVMGKSNRTRLGIIVEISDFVDFSVEDALLAGQKEWLKNMGKRVAVYWSDDTITTQPSKCLEILD